MEDHLRNKDRLQKEWEALCSYQAEPSSVSIAQSESNMEKNRCPDFVPCKSSDRIHLQYSMIYLKELKHFYSARTHSSRDMCYT